MQQPVNGQNGGTFGVNGSQFIRAAVESEKRRQQKENANAENGNPDFANGRGDDPRSRGAESQMDIIMNGN